MRQTCWTVAVVALLLVAGCASGPKPGSRAPDFDAVDATGDTISSTSLAGKTVIYYFWATWCAPCVVSSPEIQDLHVRFANDDRVRVIGVHYDASGDPPGYLAQKGYTWRLIADGRDVVAAFGIKKIPQVVVVGPDGEVAFSQIGFAEGDGPRIAEVVADLSRSAP